MSDSREFASVPSSSSHPSATVSGLAAADWASARGERWRDHASAMEATMAPVDEPLFAALRLDAPCRIADIGCGAGGGTLALQRMAPAGSTVRGFDISPALIASCRERARREGVDVAFECADVSVASSGTAGYDRLVSRFGVMFFDDPAAAFANLATWLAPSGRLAFAVWANPADNAWIDLARDVVGRVVPLPSLSPDAPTPFRYAKVEPLLALLRDGGLVDVEAATWRGEMSIGGGLPPADAARFALSAFSSFGELLARAGDAALAEATASLTERFATRTRDGAVRLDASVHVVTARRR